MSGTVIGTSGGESSGQMWFFFFYCEFYNKFSFLYTGILLDLSHNLGFLVVSLTLLTEKEREQDISRISVLTYSVNRIIIENYDNPLVEFSVNLSTKRPPPPPWDPPHPFPPPRPLPTPPFPPRPPRPDLTKEEAARYENLIAGLSTSEIVDRYGSANAQHIIGCSGVDNETGQVLQKGLKEISTHKVHPDYEDDNLRQQAGLSAEVKNVACTNAENIINKRGERIARTDDITVDGKNQVNHPQYDHVKVDKHGRPILDQDGNLTGGSQQKCHSGDVSKYDKYSSNPELYEKYKGTEIKVPSDQYEDIQRRYSEQIRKLEQQEQRLRADGKCDLADRKRAEIERKKDVKERLRDSGVSTEKALEARKYPVLSTAKEMGSISHRAGLEAAKGAAVISGAISIVQNSIAFAQGDKDLQEALTDTAKTTAKSAGTAYISAAAGSLIKSGLQQSKHAFLRGLAKTSLPALAVTTCIETGKCLKRYIQGEIDEVELLQDLGKTGTGMVAGGLGAALGQIAGKAMVAGGFSVTLGQIAIPIPVVGAIVGGMIGYTINSLFYTEALNALQGAKESEEHYYRTKAICEAARSQLHAYEQRSRAEFEAQFTDSVRFYQNAFERLNESILSGDRTRFERAIQSFADRIGKALRYKTFSEFDDAMNSDRTILI